MSQSGLIRPSGTDARNQASSLTLKSNCLEKCDTRDHALKNIRFKPARSNASPLGYLVNAPRPAPMIFPIPITPRSQRPEHPAAKPTSHSPCEQGQGFDIWAGFAPVSCPRGRRMGSESGQSGVGLRLSKRNKSWDSLRCPCHRLSGTSNT